MKKTFDQTGDWQAITAAEQWCKEQGISWGRMCGSSPIGLKRGEWDIMKWRNLSQEDINGLDGTITGDMRNGPVTVNLKDQNERSDNQVYREGKYYDDLMSDE